MEGKYYFKGNLSPNVDNWSGFWLVVFSSDSSSGLKCSFESVIVGRPRREVLICMSTPPPGQLWQSWQLRTAIGKGVFQKKIIIIINKGFQRKHCHWIKSNAPQIHCSVIFLNCYKYSRHFKVISVYSLPNVLCEPFFICVNLLYANDI